HAICFVMRIGVENFVYIRYILGLGLIRERDAAGRFVAGSARGN
ncbi:MAG: hypothetical protein JWQ44_2987, partial [Chthoniobacter sp.]|nr:hypothetical protein [Chthoniobacter sp.]